MKNKYQLIWFQHFHKAAGSSVVDLARRNREVFWPDHSNGNPINNCGHLLELWNYDEKKLTGFINTCEQRGITFVATEWGFPNIYVLHKDPRVLTLTILREPLRREP